MLGHAKGFALLDAVEVDRKVLPQFTNANGFHVAHGSTTDRQTQPKEKGHGESESQQRPRWTATGVARAALEALAADAVRSGKLTPFQARHLLGVRSRYEMDGFLKAHGVFLDVTMADVRSDSDTALAMSR